MAVALRAVGSNSSGSGSNATATITKPSSPGTVVDGDTMYVFFSWPSQTTTLSPPAGWTSISGPFDAPSGSMRHQLFRKVASSEGASWSWTFSVAVLWCASIWVGSGIDATTPNQTPSITAMSGAAPFNVTAVPAAQGTWGVYFAGCDATTALTWTDTATERVDGNNGTGTSFLARSCADSNGIITSSGTCGFTPSGSIQGGAVASIGVNASPAVASAGLAAVAVDAGAPGQTSTSNAAAGLATVSVAAYGASGGLTVNTDTATVAALAYGVQAVALTLPVASVAATAYGATVAITQPAGLAEVAVDAHGVGLRHATPSSRIRYVPAESRTFTVQRDSRGRTVPTDDRSYPA